jgi:Kelch motif
MSVGRTAFTATLLQNGEVLVAGGTDYNENCWNTAELYNPSTGQWTLTGSMIEPRCLHSATLLSNGEVLVSGDDSVRHSQSLHVMSCKREQPVVTRRAPPLAERVSVSLGTTVTETSPDLCTAT